MATVVRPIVLAAGVVGAVVAAVRRHKSKADAELWREATSDSSR